MLHALTILFASTEGEESSQAIFYIGGGVLAAFAVVISVIGISRIDSFPASRGQARGVIGLAALLVLAAMASAIISS